MRIEKTSEPEYMTVDAYTALTEELMRIKNSYRKASEYWYLNKARYIVEIAKFLYDLNVLTNQQYDEIDTIAFYIVTKFDDQVNE